MKLGTLIEKFAIINCVGILILFSLASVCDQYRAQVGNIFFFCGVKCKGLLYVQAKLVDWVAPLVAHLS